MQVIDQESQVIYQKCKSMTKNMQEIDPKEKKCKLSIKSMQIMDQKTASYLSKKIHVMHTYTIGHYNPSVWIMA